MAAPVEFDAAEQTVDRARQLRARRALFFVAGLVLAFALVDGLSTGAFPAGTLLVRAVWATLVLVVALRLPLPERTLFNRNIRWLVTWSSVALALIVHMNGGSSTILFAVLPALPLTVVVLTQDDGAAAWLVSAIATASMVTILWMERASVREIAAWALFGAGMGALAIVGSGLYRAREAHVVSIERQRVAALERSAELEQMKAKADRARAESERLVLLGTLAAAVAHEINNPLAFVKSNLAFAVEEQRSSNPEVAEALSEAAAGVARIEQIVRDMKSLARADAGHDEAFALASVVDEAIRIASLRLKTVAAVRRELPATLPSVYGERGKLLQVLVNLLVNAADALEGSGDPANAFVALTASSDEEWITLTVEDNGPGLSPEALRRAFEPFFTTKPAGRGTGLGLAISRDAVERLGGQLIASNRPEGGARFAIRLPVIRDAAQSAAPPDALPSGVPAPEPHG